MVAYADASYATDRDLSSPLGFIVVLIDGNKSCQPVHWTPYKSKCVARSVLKRKIMAFAVAFDTAYTIKRALQAMLSQPVSLSVMTDSLSLFAALTKSWTKTEKWLTIDIQTVKESYRNKDLYAVAFMCSEHNMGDALTKVKSHCGLTERNINRHTRHMHDKTIVYS